MVVVFFSWKHIKGSQYQAKKNGEGAVVEHPREFSREYHSKLFDNYLINK